MVAVDAMLCVDSYMYLCIYVLMVSYGSLYGWLRSIGCEAGLALGCYVCVYHRHIIFFCCIPVKLE